MSLQVKVVAFLVAIALVPLAVAGVLINETAKVAHNFASNETAFLRPPLERARSAYLDLIATKRDLYYRQVALRVAALPEVIQLVAPAERSPVTPVEPGADQPPGQPGADQTPGQSGADQTPGQPPGQPGAEPPPDQPAPIDPEALASARLAEILADTPELHWVAIVDSRARPIVEQQTLTPLGVEVLDWRPVPVTEPIPGTDAQVSLVFAVDPVIQRDYTELSRALEGAERIDEVRSALPSSYRLAYFLLVGGLVLVVTVVGIVIARRFTRRIYTLVSGTREVAAGDLAARVALPGRDELAELARAFNRMVEELEHDRGQIVYLQRISAWQDVARKLAHEIKNPLTPIQLAVQQCCSSYRGDDERYRRLLADTEEIVTEEISGLRRLVDAFRTLGQLPRVDARPLDLASVVDDLTRDPTLLDHLEIHPPDGRALIRGDRMLLRRVLTNLVENGVHAGRGAGTSGKVVVRWTTDDERVRLTVDDQGPGVPADRRDKIFEPYVTHKEEGTGLGLTISKKITLDHHGSLQLSRDPAPTGGARFVLTLPLADDEEAAPDDEDDEDDAPTATAS